MFHMLEAIVHMVTTLMGVILWAGSLALSIFMYWLLYQWFTGGIS